MLYTPNHTASIYIEQRQGSYAELREMLLTPITAVAVQSSKLSRDTARRVAFDWLAG